MNTLVRASRWLQSAFARWSMSTTEAEALSQAYRGTLDSHQRTVTTLEESVSIQRGHFEELIASKDRTIGFKDEHIAVLEGHIQFLNGIIEISKSWEELAKGRTTKIEELERRIQYKNGIIKNLEETVSRVSGFAIYWRNLYEGKGQVCQEQKS